MTTIVTALYDIGREKIDGRGIEQYLQWFKKTLQLNCPMVIYCENENVDFIKKHRSSKLKTEIIVQQLDNIPYFYLKEKMDEILKDPDYISKIKDPNRIECQTSLYSIIQYSKFAWVKDVSEKNYFNSDYFLWMDAGLSRFMPSFDINQKFPGNNFLSRVKEIPSKPLFQIYMLPYSDLYNAKDLTTEYFYDNRSYVMGGMFGSDKNAINWLKEKVEFVLTEEMLSQNKFNNEQIAIGYLLKKYPNEFLVLRNNNQVHRNFELIYQSFF